MHQSAHCKMRRATWARQGADRCGHFNDTHSRKKLKRNKKQSSAVRMWRGAIHFHPHLRHIKHRCAQTRQLRLFFIILYYSVVVVAFFFTPCARFSEYGTFACSFQYHHHHQTHILTERPSFLLYPPPLPTEYGAREILDWKCGRQIITDRRTAGVLYRRKRVRKPRLFLDSLYTRPTPLTIDESHRHNNNNNKKGRTVGETLPGSMLTVSNEKRHAYLKWQTVSPLSFQWPPAFSNIPALKWINGRILSKLPFAFVFFSIRLYNSIEKPFASNSDSSWSLLIISSIVAINNKKRR